MNTKISPTGIAPPAANYAHAMLTTDATSWLHTAGVVPARPDGTVPDDIGEQATVVWANVAAILDEAGMTAADIVSYTTYAVTGSELGPVMTARDAFFGDNVAASTLVTLPALARPEWQIEIAVIAAR